MKAYGIDLSCWPSVWEVIQAEKVFTEYIANHKRMMRRKELIQCALAAVWKAGRLYQMTQNPEDK